MNDTMRRFKERQAKIIADASKERKEQGKARQQAVNREYWDDIAWQIDRMYDGSDEQPYEPEEKEK